MKPDSTLPKVAVPAWLWNTLTIVFVSLTSLVCLLYGLVFAFPQFVPSRFRPATPPAVSTALPPSALGATQPFPTLPPEWTAAFATRLTPARVATQTPQPSLTFTRTPSKTATVASTAAQSPTSTAAPGKATPTSMTATSPPPSPQATSTSSGYPEGDTPLPGASPSAYP